MTVNQRIGIVGFPFRWYSISKPYRSLPIGEFDFIDI